ncbi:1-deoxy-D-xylulose-5-phosphate synthase [Anaerocolumna cellulosilytica]|uniref:1-deoxy-D-xylulose-5-phosphate synthase n=1 Tax=Anaerocolumna cellulosilytica TaxID=433286 RepID=A0A6S6R306_9FIRM|nr:1-deoxy-D-xylulose-5-phosphate synthase [Anaerocolumna cellulosilytica]MBB5196609.1 1-deoxy-D-xylulose-5-phosphate synthase [Anaerocolumna cellulosilytica]BCJ95709.1 1-deoxy-D-xylulose-5-phosphate synthase [Anaerocolumna cellulosilytica]
MTHILDEINQANDIKKIDSAEYKKLAAEIRKFLVQNISKTGGHLASNLGAVELTMALHLYLDFPKDRLVWDVGHQAYTHKLLTGRKKEFTTLRTYEGLSGFPKKKESICDAFDTGHSSTSISAAMGLVNARELSGEDYRVVAVIGDGALSGGMAFEALNNAEGLHSNLTIVLNDNNMSISENVGGMANYLGQLRTDTKYNNFKSSVENFLKKIPGIGNAIMDKLKKSKDSLKRLVIPGMLFEDMGITYIGPIDGHDINQLMTAFASASKVKEAVLIHVVTKKGKGYKPAEQNPSKFHGVEAFDVKTGENFNSKKDTTYTEVFSDTITELGKCNEKIVAITAAMPSGTGLNKFMKSYPERFFDVGIAEEHAVTYAAGLAVGGMKPFVAIYSTFLQRAYDQILHDVCISNLPVVFAIDRAGLVGNDGETHQGIFDISYLSHMPSLTFVAPKNAWELKEMLIYAGSFQGPIAIRYPRGKAYQGLKEYKQPIEYGKGEIIYEISESLPKELKEMGKSQANKKNIVLLAVGSMVETAENVSRALLGSGHKVTLVNMRFIKPFDEELLHRLAVNHGSWVTLEENVKLGGFGERITGFLMEHNYREINQLNISLPDQFIEQGDVAVLKEKLGMDSESIKLKILEFINSNA